MYKTILITFFSFLLLTGCTHVSPVEKAWILPTEPILGKPVFQKEGERLYLEKEDAVILRNNIVELKAYQEKLIVLISEMKDYYSNK